MKLTVDSSEPLEDALLERERDEEQQRWKERQQEIKQFSENEAQRCGV